MYSSTAPRLVFSSTNRNFNGDMDKYKSVNRTGRWKETPTRAERKNLMRLGVDATHAYAFSRTRKGGWAVAQSPILTTTITLKRLQQRGYESLLDYYYQVSPQFSEPLYT